MTAEYSRVPSAPGVRPSTSPRRWALRAALALAGVVVLHYAVLGFSARHMSAPRAPVVTEDAEALFAELESVPDAPFPEPPPATGGVAAVGVDEGAEEETEEPQDSPEPERLSAETLRVLAELPRGPLVQDVYPVRTMRAFLELAELEIRRAGADTCRDRLGAPLVRDWAATGRRVCRPAGREAELRSSITTPDSESTLAFDLDSGRARRAEAISARRRSDAASVESREQKETHELEPGSITCFNPKDGRGSSWWAMGSYPCVSTGLQTSGNASRFATPLDCTLPRSRDQYALANVLDGGQAVQCAEWVNTTTLLVHRRDEWNP